MVKRIAERIKLHGGTAYYVGGYVRDRILGIENKDIDIEVHGVEVEALRELLSNFGEILEIGESFGIFTIKGTDIDIAVPRTERAVGRGHRDFIISADPFIGTKKAAQRRDFTVNALMENVLTGEIIDHFGGLTDLENKVLRHVNDNTFPEDPLRVLRLCQFAARFGFTPARETLALCRKIDLSALSAERVEGELKKALLKAEKPSVFFETLREAGGLDFRFPELKALIGVPQNPVYHPEGDVWTHTMQVLDRAAAYRERTSSPFAFMLTAIVHDMGKAVTTKEINGVYHAYNHEKEGLPIVKEFLSRITKEKDVISYAVNMTLLHMKPLVMLRADSKMKSFNKLFDGSVSPTDLIYFALSDSGEDEDSTGRQLFEKLDTFNEIMSRPFVQGRDLIKAGLKPGKSFSEILSLAHKLRLAGVSKEVALRQCIGVNSEFGIRNSENL